MNDIKERDRVYYYPNILWGLGTVLSLSKSGKTALVRWPDPYNTGKKPAYYRLKNLRKG